MSDFEIKFSRLEESFYAVNVIGAKNETQAIEWFSDNPYQFDWMEKGRRIVGLKRIASVTPLEKEKNDE